MKTKHLFPYLPENDGIDHIRLDRHSNSNLGRQLAIDNARTFYLPDLGSFTSISSAIQYMKLEVKDDKLRTLTSNPLFSYVKEEISKGNNRYVNKQIPDREYKRITLYSLLSRPELLEMLINSKLPMVSYYISDGEIKVKDMQYTRVLMDLRKHFQDKPTDTKF